MLRYLLAGIGLSLAGAPAALAQDNRDLSDDAVFCRLVESLGNGNMNARVLSDINRVYAGATYKINRRKAFVIEEVQAVRFDGCNMTIPMKVVLKRKIRRDASGTATVKAVMKNLRYNPGTGDGRSCVKNARIDDIDVSNTLRVGEAIYRRVANRFVEQDVCFDFRR